MAHPIDLLAPFIPHPITDRQYWDTVSAHPSTAPLIAELMAGADPLPPVPRLPHASDFLAARRNNNRNPTDRAWQIERQHLSALMLRRCVLGLEEQDPDDRLLDWLWGFLNQPTWVVAAHLPGNDLPAAGSPQLDLAGCEMAASLAEGLEVLGAWMDSVSGTLRQTIIDEIDRRVLTPFVNDSEQRPWASEAPDPHRNNWTGVCAGSILVACEALARLGHPRPDARERALRLLRIFFDEAFTPGGECDEGTSYWNYGVGVACLGLMRLDPAEVREWIPQRRLEQVAAYPGQTHLFDDYFYAGNDAQLQARAALYFVPWLAAMTGDRFLRNWIPTTGGQRMPTIVWRTIEALRRGSHEQPASETFTHPPVREVPDQQVFIVERPSGGRQMIVILAGGHNGERHNHNDVGHFLVAVDKKIIIPDMGAPGYTTDFFGARRYTYIPASSRGHCCPIINGHEQRKGRDAAGRVIERSLDAESPVYSLDMTSAYPPEAGLQRWTRTLGTEDQAAVIDDHFECGAAGAVTHVIWTLVEPVIDGAGIKLDALSMTLDPAPRALRAVPVTGTSLNLRQFRDKTLYRIEADYPVEARKPLRVQTRLTCTGA